MGRKIMNPSWTFARMGGSPWPKGFVPKVEDPFEDLNDYIEWLETFPFDLQAFIDNQSELVRIDLRQLASAGIDEYRHLVNGNRKMNHREAMHYVLYTVR